MSQFERLIFLVHPCCYAASLPRPPHWKEKVWQAYHQHELPVLRRWYEMLDRMDEKEVVVYHPCYQSAEERALAEHGRRRLGDRFLTLGGREILSPDGFAPEVLAALAPEIQEAFRVRGKYTWSVHDLRIAVFSYNYAQDLLKLLALRELHFQPEQLSLRAVGESFEGCATTWSTMVPVYLGVPGPVEIHYELTVPDTYFLLQSRYVKRLALAHHTALYLFVDPQGRPMALYKRERVALADPSFYARLPLQASQLEVRTMQGRSLLTPRGHLPASVPPSLVRHGEGSVDLMVASGRGRGGEGPPYYPREAPLFIAARDLAPGKFFAMAERAQIVPEKGA